MLLKQKLHSSVEKYVAVEYPLKHTEDFDV